ncbi:hypothetical protein [Brumimicrobium oceani]|uniref:Uncharacterized protein n=1 Tax=Brumimicrobium oceani TaxID=2100725 RepID=A0A2U2XGX4_9FLAO|nr:hypothetical protein [Brumimicrobium oceani]PWH87049.1 hypothetical protein DIT68_01965 [Brumimicrobium oceani]
MKTINKNLAKKLIPLVNKVSDNDPIHSSLKQALFIYFDYGYETTYELYTLMYELIEIIKEKDLGVYDGNELALDHSDGIMYMYGPSAERLFNGIKSTLEKVDFMKGAKANMRFGPLEGGKNEITVQIK